MAPVDNSPSVKVPVDGKFLLVGSLKDNDSIQILVPIYWVLQYTVDFGL